MRFRPIPAATCRRASLERDEVSSNYFPVRQGTLNRVFPACRGWQRLRWLNWTGTSMRERTCLMHSRGQRCVTVEEAAALGWELAPRR
jgi:hypothetical protein